MGKRITIDDLAHMIQEHVVTKMATKEELHTGFQTVNSRLDKVDIRLDRIENLLLRDHLNRIERLEDSIRVVKTKVGLA